MCSEIVPHKGNVSLEIVLELGEPVRAVLIGRLTGGDAEDVRPAVTRFADLALERLAQRLVRDENVRRLQACEVEGLARRGAGDRHVRKGGADRSKDRVRVAGADKVCVDLVRDDLHALAQADFAHARKLVPGPDPAHWVVRTAEDEGFDALLLDRALEIIVVDAVAAAFKNERTDCDAPSVVADGAGKRVVDRLLNEHRVVFARQRADGVVDGEDNARRLHQPLALRFP